MSTIPSHEGRIAKEILDLKSIRGMWGFKHQDPLISFNIWNDQNACRIILHKGYPFKCPDVYVRNKQMLFTDWSPAITLSDVVSYLKVQLICDPSLFAVDDEEHKVPIA